MLGLVRHPRWHRVGGAVLEDASRQAGQPYTVELGVFADWYMNLDRSAMYGRNCKGTPSILRFVERSERFTGFEQLFLQLHSNGGASMPSA